MKVVLACLVFVLGAGCKGDGAAGRSEQVASWIGAARGVVRVWSDGSVSAAYADNNLQSTEMMLRREVEGASPLGPASRERVRRAADVIASVRESVRAGDRAAAAAAAARLEVLAAELAGTNAGGNAK